MQFLVLLLMFFLTFVPCFPFYFLVIFRWVSVFDCLAPLENLVKHSFHFLHLTFDFWFCLSEQTLAVLRVACYLVSIVAGKVFMCYFIFVEGTSALNVIFIAIKFFTFSFFIISCRCSTNFIRALRGFHWKFQIAAIYVIMCVFWR